MTTAARPTFDTARGGGQRGETDLSAMSKQYSSRDLPSHTRLKQREMGQGTTDEIKGKDFRKELEDRERAVRGRGDNAAKREHLTSSHSSSTKRARIGEGGLDADDPLDDTSDDNSDSDDDTEALMAELAKIKRERAEEDAKKEAERKQEEERIRMENIISGNPIFNQNSSNGQLPKSDIKVKKRWDHDVVFKNCARAAPDKSKPEFINDSLRNEFHKKFMDKYIK